MIKLKDLLTESKPMNYLQKANMESMLRDWQRKDVLNFLHRAQKLATGGDVRAKDIVKLANTDLDRRNTRGEGAINEDPKSDASLGKDTVALLLLRKSIVQAMGQALDLGNRGHFMKEITDHLAKANKLLNAWQRKVK